MRLISLRFGARLSAGAVCMGVLALFAAAAVGSLAQTAAPATQQVLPTGAGHDVFVKTCSGCHSTSLATSQRKSADDWVSVVIEMRSRGAQGSDEDMEAIVGYLATNFGLATPPPHVNINAAPAAEIAGALSLSLEQGSAIVAYRNKNGKFKDVAGVEQVPGTEITKIEAAKDRIDF